MSHRPRSAHPLLVIGGSLGIYVAAALLGARLAGGAIAGAAIAALVAIVAALGYRRWSTGSLRTGAPGPLARSDWIWLIAPAGLVSSWFMGHALALWVVQDQSPGSETTTLDGPAWLAVITVLLLAPVGEELLFRGVVYTSLRTRLPVLPSALASAALFAVMHGSVKQIALTFAFGVVLALVYEATLRLWPVIAMHILFNIASSTIPVESGGPFSNPLMLVLSVLLTVIVSWALLPGTSFRSAILRSNPSAPSGTEGVTKGV